MCLLKANHLCKTYQTKGEQVRVLKDLSLKIRSGELIAVMGASGSGKSTLLNLLCGIDAPDSGEIMINGKSITSFTDEELASFRKEQFGMIFQDFQLLESLNVRENILVPMILKKCAIKEQEQAYSRVIKPLHIRPLENRRLSEISGGQRQRVAIARAFIHSPALIFADEPTGNLDAEATRDVMEQIQQMNRLFGTSMLIVTHDSYVASFCDRILLLKNGKFADTFPGGAIQRAPLPDGMGALEIPFVPIPKHTLSPDGMGGV